MVEDRAIYSLYLSGVCDYCLVSTCWWFHQHSFVGIIYIFSIIYIDWHYFILRNYSGRSGKGMEEVPGGEDLHGNRDQVLGKSEWS